MKKIIKKRAGLIALIAFLAGTLLIASCAPGTPQPRGWAGPVVSNNSVIVGSMSGTLVSIDRTTGARQWSVSLGSGQQPSGGFGCSAPSAVTAVYGTPAVNGDLVYVGTYLQTGNVSQGKVYAFTAGRSDPKWVYPSEGFLGGPIVGGLVVANGKLYFTTANNKVYALDAVDGFKVAEFTTGDKIWATPVVDGNIVYVSSFDKKLYALDAGTLQPVKWGEFQTDGALITASAISSDTIYVGSFDRNLYAIDKEAGTLKWKYPADNWFWSSPVLFNNTIYAPNLDKKVYIVDAVTGLAKAPPLNLGSPISSTPIEVGGKIIVATEAGQIYSIDTGSNSSTLVTDLKETVNAPLIAADNVIYIHSQADSLYALDLATGAVRPFVVK